jgi:UDP-glucose:(heptosyl)LPS alpha-1,3-glucosyltransferase
VATDTCGYATHVEQAQAGEIIPSPFDQVNLNFILKEVLINSKQRCVWAENGKVYVQHTDVYGRHKKAADTIEETASKINTK